VSQSEIRLVVNADDYGMTPAISRGIVRAHREGIVTSTSVLGNCPDLPGALRLLGEAPELGVGVHVTLVGGAPVCPAATVPSLCDGAGQLHATPRTFIKSWMRGIIQQADVEREIEAQVKRVWDAGIRPDHLDTHHHLGFIPAVGQALEGAARRHGISGIRSAVERPTIAWIAEPRRGLEAGVLSGLSWLLRRRMGALRHGPQSWGFVEIGQLDEVRILEIIGRLSPGPNELICHPGDEDDSVTAGAESRYHRVDELRALRSPKVRAALDRRGVVLCRWADLV
jgi:predicted glycoside hydrolase/deacetylase ChbG (UPF0249 family)